VLDYQQDPLPFNHMMALSGLIFFDPSDSSRYYLIPDRDLFDLFHQRVYNLLLCS